MTYFHKKWLIGFWVVIGFSFIIFEGCLAYSFWKSASTDFAVETTMIALILVAALALECVVLGAWIWTHIQFHRLRWRAWRMTKHGVHAVATADGNTIVLRRGPFDYQLTLSYCDSDLAMHYIIGESDISAETRYSTHSTTQHGTYSTPSSPVHVERMHIYNKRGVVRHLHRSLSIRPA